MKWNTILLIISISMLLFLAGANYINYLGEADAIAAQLAPKIGVQEDILRSNLWDILKSFRLAQIIVHCTPWAILSLLLTGKILVDVVKKRKGRGCSGLDGNGRRR